MKNNKLVVGLAISILVILVINNIYLLVKIFQFQSILSNLASPPSYGLAVGSIAPELSVSDINGSENNLYHLLEKDYNLLLFFSPDCAACLNFLPEIDKFSKEFEAVNIIVISKGDPKQINEVFSNFSTEVQFILWDENLAGAFEVIGTPFIYLISNEKEVLVAGLSTSMKDIKQLVSN